jgi:peptidoglycan/xylan/chitin deacetylase (PgdA/CDA1 family)
MEPRFPYVPTINRPAITWPDGARIAFYVGVNIEYFDIDRPNPRMPEALRPDMIPHVMHDYGSRVGVFRIMDVLDRHAMRASVLLNAEVCERQPAIIEEGKKRRWEWLGHGMTNQRSMPSYREDEERAVIRQVKETIAAATGSPPKGWLGPGLAETFRTPDHLAAEGFEYVCDWGCDDYPIPMRVETGRMLAMPYQQGLNDIPLLSTNLYSGEEYGQAICDTFDVLFDEAASSGKVMAIPIHPFYTGMPLHIKYFDRAVQYICSHKDVWVTTAGEIADWFYQHYYERAE